MSNWNKLKQKIGASDKKKDIAKENKKSQDNEDRTFATNLAPVEAKLIGMLKRLREKAVALDCEMVGTGMNGKYSELARCSLVDSRGNVIYDEFVQPKGYVTDFRTQWSGIRKSDINKRKAVTLEQCQQEVLRLLKGRMLVGHALQNDLKVLMVSHPRMLIRDTSRYPPYMRTLPSGKKRSRALKDLTKQFLQKTIQTGEHDSAEDARCTMELYLQAQREWEVMLRQKKLKGKDIITITATITTTQQKVATVDEDEDEDSDENEYSDEEIADASDSENEKEQETNSDNDDGEILIDKTSEHLQEKNPKMKRKRSSKDDEEKDGSRSINSTSQPLLKKCKLTLNSTILPVSSSTYTALAATVNKKDVKDTGSRSVANCTDKSTRRSWITKQQRRDQRKMKRQTGH